MAREERRHEASDANAWDRYMAAERQELEHRLSAHLAKPLGEALPGESPEGLTRWP